MIKRPHASRYQIVSPQGLAMGGIPTNGWDTMCPHVVGDEDDGQPLLSYQCHQLIHHLALLAGGDPAGRLIEYD